MIVSVLASSNRVSLSVSLFVLLALFAPTLLPGGAKQGWAGELLQRVNPMTAAEHYIRNVVISQYDWTKELSWLVSPIAASVVLVIVAIFVVPTLHDPARRLAGMRAMRLLLIVAACLLATAPAASAQQRPPRVGGFIEPLQVDVSVSRDVGFDTARRRLRLQHRDHEPEQHAPRRDWSRT